MKLRQRIHLLCMALTTPSWIVTSEKVTVNCPRCKRMVNADSTCTIAEMQQQHFDAMAKDIDGEAYHQGATNDMIFAGEIINLREKIKKLEGLQ